MPLEFAVAPIERRFTSLTDAFAYLESHPVNDVILDAQEIKFYSLNAVRLKGGRVVDMTRSAFVQMLHFLDLNWEDVKGENEGTVLREVRKRLKYRSGQLMLRTKHGVVQAVVSPNYTSITNLDVLRNTAKAVDLSKAHVTLCRGQIRITGVSDKVTFEPEVGDIISGGWEITNNEFGKGVLSVNQFLLRLVCTNGSVLQASTASDRYIHRGWDRDTLMQHIGAVSRETIARMNNVNEALKRMTQTKMGTRRLGTLVRASAASLGQKGLEQFHKEIEPSSSVYDAYNYLTFVSQGKSLGPRRELELIAGSLVSV